VWREEGIEEGRLEIAREMFADGDNIKKIARNAKIPLDTLKKKFCVQ